MLKLNKVIVYIHGKIIREIDFSLNDVNYILGEVEKKEGTTSNSLGKSSLINLIDLVYGADKNKIKLHNLSGLSIKGVFDNKDEAYRVLGSKNEFYYNNNKLIKSKYVEKVERKNIGIQAYIHKEQRKGIIEYNSRGKDLYNFQIIFNILKLNKCLENTEKYSEYIKTIEEKIAKKKDYDGNDEKFIKLEKEIEILEGKIKKIEENNEKVIKQELESKYNDINQLETERKKLKYQIASLESSNKIYKESLKEAETFDNNFIDEFLDVLSHEEISLIKKNTQEVKLFHEEHLKERKKRVQEEIVKNNKNLETLKNKLYDIETKIPQINEILKSNTELEMLFKNYSELSHELITKKEAYSLKTLRNKLDEELKKLEQRRNELSGKILTEKEEMNKKFKIYVDYTNKLINEFYDEQLSSSLTIGVRDLVRKKDKNNLLYPYEFKFEVDKDSGEGISAVKNIIIDLTGFKYNEKIKFQIWDSECFNGIDPIQIEKIFNEIEKICKESKKQALVTINKFQINKEILEKIEGKVVLKLSENKTLFGYDF